MPESPNPRQDILAFGFAPDNRPASFANDEPRFGMMHLDDGIKLSSGFGETL